MSSLASSTLSFASAVLAYMRFGIERVTLRHNHHKLPHLLSILFNSAAAFNSKLDYAVGTCVGNWKKPLAKAGLVGPDEDARRAEPADACVLFLCA